MNLYWLFHDFWRYQSLDYVQYISFQSLNIVYLIRFFFLFAFVSDMRRDVQEIFRSTAQTKQVMMFSATLSKEIRPVCKKFMHDVITTSMCI